MKKSIRFKTNMFLILISLALNGHSAHMIMNYEPATNQTYQESFLSFEEEIPQDPQESDLKSNLESKLFQLQSKNNFQKENLLKQLANDDKSTIEIDKNQIDSIRNSATGFPVIGVLNDTLFFVYSKIGAFTPQERALSIGQKIERLYDDDFLKVDSIKVVQSENSYDIVYGELIVMSISESEAKWYGISMLDLASSFKEIIQKSIVQAKNETSWLKTIFRSLLVLLVFAVAWLIVWLIRKGNSRLLLYIDRNREKWTKNLSYKDYTYLSAEQEMKVILFLTKVLRWFVYILLLYFTLPIIFSIFPFSRDWADALFLLIWSPFKGVLIAVWHYLPKLFSILVIYFIMKYVIRFVRYIFLEIESEKLKLSGFHADWAMPTYSIVKFLLYAFMFVLIFPYLPGSDSTIFKGVSVFIGVLFSLGSSTAIANMVAGLVITYMRPFKIGDRIRIGDVSGDVVEKSLLVTRVKSIKNEIITIPNSAVLNGNTTNYSSEAAVNGLIVHTTVTIGYDVPWKNMHQALIDAALKTDMINKEPKPFVLQTSLDDFYVSYQINAFTHEASKQALIYSSLHQNIQDVCNERGIEILSPHYRSARDGNKSTISPEYLPKDYEAPKFTIKLDASGDK